MTNKNPPFKPSYKISLSPDEVRLLIKQYYFSPLREDGIIQYRIPAYTWHKRLLVQGLITIFVEEQELRLGAFDLCLGTDFQLNNPQSNVAQIVKNKLTQHVEFLKRQGFDID